MENVTKIIITKNILTKLVAHAKDSHPYESVSIIAGQITDNIALAEIVFTPENVEKSRVSFTVEALELLKIYEEIESLEKRLVAIYHTHPAPPKPSGVDIDYMEVNPYIWLISSSSKPEKPKGYLLLKSGLIREIPIEITE